jgi:hypothetical protein
MLALVDITGFDRTIWERCEGLRHHKIPFLVLSPRQSASIQQVTEEGRLDGRRKLQEQKLLADLHQAGQKLAEEQALLLRLQELRKQPDLTRVGPDLRQGA